MKILILGLAKSGTTALYFKIKNSLPLARGLFEPKRYLPLPGDNIRGVVAKVLFYNWESEEDLNSFLGFDKKIVILRDPRDILISGLLYFLWHEPFYQMEEEMKEFWQVLKKKEADPDSLSVREILKTLNEIFNKRKQKKTAAKSQLFVFFNNLVKEFAARKDVFVIKYEDFVDNKLEDLEQYLGFKLVADPVLPENLKRVERAKYYGDWKNWFKEEDLNWFKEQIGATMAQVGYTDWKLNDHKIIRKEHCSEYVARIVNEKRQANGLAKINFNLGVADNKANDNLYVFYHIPKTGGTAFIKNIVEDLKDGSLCLYPSFLLPKDNKMLDNEVFENFPNYVKAYVSSLSEEKKQSIKFISGHNIPVSLLASFKKTIRPIIFFRDPLARIISFYNYQRGRLKRGMFIPSNIKDSLMENGKLASLEKFLSKNQFIKTQSIDILLSKEERILPILEKLSLAKKRLKKFYFVGITEKSYEDFLYLWHMMGLNNFSYRKINSSRKYQIADDNLKQKLQKELQYEYELYNYAFRLNQEFKKGNNHFWSIVKSAQIQNDCPKVSVLMPSYNYGRYIREAIDSVLSQNFKDFELIIIDDGSTDNSREIIGEYANKYPKRIKFFSHFGNAHRGLAETYRLGLRKAKGKYIAFLEADDKWEKDYLASKVDVLDKNLEVAAVYNNVKLIGEPDMVRKKKRAVLRTLKNIGLHKQLKQNPFFAFKYLAQHQYIFSFSCFMTRKKLLEQVSFFIDQEERLDWWILGQLSVMGKFYHQEEKLTQWRIHKDSCNFVFEETKGSAGVRAVNENLRKKIIKYAADYLNNVLVLNNSNG